jgi:hypothetical protein
MEKGAPPANVATVTMRSPSTANATARFLARRLAALGVGFYRVKSASVECAKEDEARVRADIDAAPRIDVWALDPVNAFGARAKDAPFPALSEDGALAIPREHEEPLVKFVATIAPPDGRKIFVGVRAGDDSFARTFVATLPPAIGGEHVARVVAEDGGGAWRVAIVLDDEGRAALSSVMRDRAGQRVAFSFDGRVVAAPIAGPAIDPAHVTVALQKGATQADAERIAARFANGARSSEAVLAP